MNAKAGSSPAPLSSPVAAVVPGLLHMNLLRNVVARLTRVVEAIEDRDIWLAEGIAYDLVEELSQLLLTAEREASAR